MWHPLQRVAETHHLNEARFVEFAMANSQEFHIVDGEVSTFYANQLIDGYKDTVGKAVYEQDRADIIRNLKQKRGIV